MLEKLRNYTIAQLAAVADNIIKVPQGHPDVLMYIDYRKLGMNFLIDTGNNISLIPPKSYEWDNLIPYCLIKFPTS